MKTRLLKQIRKEFQISYFSNEHNERLMYLYSKDRHAGYFCNNVHDAICKFGFYGSRWLQSKIKELFEKRFNKRVL